MQTLQRLEEEQSKLDAFREQSLRTVSLRLQMQSSVPPSRLGSNTNCNGLYFPQALTQERRRYGFVLERQCSLAKHFMSLHTRGSALFQQRLPDWQRVARAREALPDEVQRLFSSKNTVSGL